MSLRDTVLALRTEVNCRIEHGAESGGHLEYVQERLDDMLAAFEDDGEILGALDTAVAALTAISQGHPQPIDRASEVLLNLLGRLP